MPSKIEKELTPEEVVELLDTLAKTPGGDMLRVIQAEAEKRGLKISPMSATTFRDGALHPYLEKLKATRQKSSMLAEAITDGDESGLLATNRLLLAEKINDVLMVDDVTLANKELLTLSKSLQGLTSANTGDKLTTARLREFEARDEERREKKQSLEKRKKAITKKGGLSKEAIELMEETFQLLG